MALSNKHRSSVYRGLAPVIGEEEVEALLSQFPARELDEPATKEFVRAEIAGLRGEIAELRSGMHGEIAEVRSENRAEVAALRAEVHERLREMTIWVAGALVGGLTAGMGVAAAIGAAVG